jgi:hypothetical protein
MKIAFLFSGKRNTFIKVSLLHKADRGNFYRDVIRMEAKSQTHHIKGDMTEEEALLLADGLVHAIIMKKSKEKKL